MHSHKSMTLSITPFSNPNPKKNNRIRNTRYEWWNAVPKNLMEQLQTLSNIYFICFLILLSIKEVTISDSPIPFTIALLVVFISRMIKDFITDYRKRKLDKQENTQKVLLFSTENNSFNPVLSQSLQVGDVIKILSFYFIEPISVKLNEEERIPADCVILSVSSSKNVGFVETKEIDGESSLKSKKGLKLDPCNLTNMKFQVDHPNPFIYTFEGVLERTEGKTPIGFENFLIRGTKLKNTDFVIAMVVYAGMESKIALNNKLQKVKFSSLFAELNTLIKLLILIQIAISLFMAAGYLIWHNIKFVDLAYLEFASRDDVFTVAQFFILVGRWNLILSQIPISITLLLEIIRAIQTLIMSKDDLLNKNSKNYDITIYNQQLLEEIGQIDQIFSDKTGTLTTNVLNLNCISADSKIFNQADNLEITAQNVSNILHMNLLTICLCHSINVDKNGAFHSSSPDELALMNFAKSQNYIFNGFSDEEDTTFTILDCRGNKIKYSLLRKIEFSSDRKRMSVIVKDPEGNILLLIKGADDEILKRLASKNDYSSKIGQDINIFTTQGLRTLCLAYKILSQAEYKSIEDQYQALLNGENKFTQSELENNIEQNFILLGATAVKDELQTNLKEDIKFFRESGIKLWVLTGDKTETTVSVSLDSGIITPEDSLLRIEGNNPEDIIKSVEKAESVIQASGKSKNHALIISGSSFIQIEHQKEIVEKIIRLGFECQTVLFCRSTPKQKGEVLAIYKKIFPKSSVLAIGDGANDVSMINTGNVGVGIRGEEGSQAARSSDFALGEFKNLRPLIFKHGRENYRRNSMIQLYIMFANNFITVTSFAWGFQNLLSGVPLFDDSLITYFQLLYIPFTAIIYASFDQEADDDVLLSDPKLYSLCLNKKYFTRKKFWLIELNSTIQGMWPFVFMSLTWELSFAHTDGQVTVYWSMASATFFASVITINLFLAQQAYRPTVALFIAMSASIILFNLTLLGVSGTEASDMYQICQDMWSLPIFYYSVFLSVVAALMPDRVYRCYQRLTKS